MIKKIAALFVFFLSIALSALLFTTSYAKAQTWESGKGMRPVEIEVIFLGEDREPVYKTILCCREQQYTMCAISEEDDLCKKD
ncbi:MAG: hypothetical protein IJU34_09505 [Bacteroidales bacterium]|nr:hypothetical protein [Bacteroidales bacterium]